ncbi:MAG: hypothetical protein HON77_01600 [Gammaproteobacteria bacterium]|jgi:hypothetical protein|nr:hypothetical protein [Gammaproteobacteria bacterium]MBT7744381.1 hypothetical protein [Alphaproteobacteria bacterium]
MTDFSDYCPKEFPRNCPKKFAKTSHANFPNDCPTDCPEDCDVKPFDAFSNTLVVDTIMAPLTNPRGHRSQRNVERDLNKLRRLLADLKEDVRIELISRECQDLKADELDKAKKIILNGGSALTKLELLAAKPFKRSIRHDAMDRANLFNFAIANFVSQGGELSTRLDSSLLHYLDAIAIAAGIEPFDALKAVQRYKKS